MFRIGTNCPAFSLSRSNVVWHSIAKERAVLRATYWGLFSWLERHGDGT